MRKHNEIYLFEWYAVVKMGHEAEGILTAKGNLQ
jgi:hypothetical protein